MSEVRSWRSRALTVLGWAVTGLLVAVAAVVVADRWDAVQAAGGLPGPAPSVAAVAAFAIGNALLAFTWRAVVAITGTRLPFAAAAWVWSVSQLARYTIGAAQVGGRAVAGRRYGLSAVAGAATTIVEIGWQLSLMAALALVTLPWWVAGGAAQLWWLAVIGAVPAAVLLIGLVAPQRLVDLLVRLGRVRVIDKVTRGRLATAQLRLNRGGALRITLLYTLNMGLRLVGFLAVFAAMGGSIASHGLAAAGGYAVGQLVGWLAVFAPGGLGPREGATALVLIPLIGAGPAVVVVAAVRLLEVVAELAFFALARALRSTAAPSVP